MNRLTIAGAAAGSVLLLAGCGSSSDAASSGAESCVVQVSNPSYPNLYNDIQFTGPGSQAQCANAAGIAPAGGTVTVVTAPQGQQMCSVSWMGMTITDYSDDSASAQAGCAWMQQRASGG